MLQLFKTRKIMVGLVFIAVIIFSFHFFSRHKNNTVSTAQDAVWVDAEQVKQGSISIEAHAIGTLVAAKHVQITPAIAGHVKKIFFDDGGVWVKQGTPLIQLDDTEYKAKLESNQANLIYSETDYKRKLFLGKQGAISQQAIDQALADLKTKQATAKQSQIEVDKMLLVAPFDGILGEINVSPGDYVTIGQGLVSLTDLRHLHVEYSVAEKYLSQLKIGQKVKLTTNAYLGKEFTGTVAFISPTINNSDRTISLYAEVTNQPQLLTAGLFVNLTQELGMEDNVLIIPAGSLVATIDGQEVYKIVDHKALAVPVTIGQYVQNTVQILTGLSKGDTIVIAGQQKLKDGMPVQINLVDQSKTS
ncbi:MAG: RND family efflux transporter MFP subunit [uncultured bacterium]|nr:MAG: RND family efflux transporter MFP subunit [uncultured bacterium]